MNTNNSDRVKGCPACERGVEAYKTKVAEVSLLCDKHSAELNEKLSGIITTSESEPLQAHPSPNSDSSWVDSLLAALPQYNLGDDPITDKPFTPEETFAIYPELAQAKQKILQKMNEARYMGSMDFATWVMRHDESSFRAERSWFKIKPSLLLSYQADLMQGLKSIQTNAGLDPNSPVTQLKSLESKGE